jgi:hypothetical protein
MLGALGPALFADEEPVLAAEPVVALGAEVRQIDDAVCADALRASTWNVAWATTFAIVAVGSAGYATLAPRDWLWGEHRAGLYVTAAKATVGTVAKLVAPLNIDVEALCRDPHPSSATARAAWLDRAARHERNALALNLLGGLTINTLGLLYLGYGRGDWNSAWVSFGVGTAVAVATTLTAPVQSWLLQRRRARSSDVVAVPVIGYASAGVALTGTW